MTDKRLRMPNDLLQVNILCTIPDGDAAQNTLYLRRQDCNDPIANKSWDDGFAATQAAALASAYETYIAALVNDSATYFEANWVWNESVPDEGPLHVGVVTGSPFPFTGATTGAPLPNGVSLAVRLQTGLGGRSNHGRIFLPLLGESATDSDTNQIKVANRADWATSMAAFLTHANNNDCVSLVGDTVTLVVASFVHAGALRPIATYNPVTAVNVSDWYLDYQRRRAPGHARHR